MKRLWLSLLLLSVVTLAIAQNRFYRPGQPPRPSDDMSWQIDSKFKHDVFTFVRVEYDSWSDRGWRQKWMTDAPDSDQNFSFRLQQLTALKVNPDPVSLRLTDPALFDYPWIYLIEPGQLVFNDEEVAALRKYLLGGGFLMVDDFWGVDEWENFRDQLKRVLPDRDAHEVPIEHPIFNCVFPIKKKPQIPNVHTGMLSEYSGITWERPDARTPEYKAIYDDKGRIIVFICHNTDLGDGWEQEGVSAYYFREFSEKFAYPLGINIVFYAMTH